MKVWGIILYVRYLALSIMGMIDGIGVQLVDFTWREKNNTLLPFDLSKEVLLFVVVRRGYITCHDIN